MLGTVTAVLHSANRLGWRSPVRAVTGGAALERGDAIVMHLAVGKRPAFLGDALGAERRVGAQQALVLLALAHILLGAFRARRRQCRTRGDQRRRQATPEQPRHSSPPVCGGSDGICNRKGLAEMRRLTQPLSSRR